MNKQEIKRIFSWSPFLVFFPILVLSLLLNPAISGVDASSSHFIYLPLMLNQTATPASETRLVVFEGFYNPT